jgi:glycosyltransferase involved in cell wall biosynthesis
MTTPLRILHAPLNIAGGPEALSHGLNAIGCDSRLLVFTKQPFRDGSDINLHLRQGGGPINLALNLPKQAYALGRALPRYDIFQFHFGVTLVPKKINLPLLGKLGKGRVFHFWGSDIRDAPATKWDYALRHADAAIIGSYATVHRAPRGKGWPEYDVVPAGIDLTAWQPAVPTPDRTIRIVHAPSRRRSKGTEAVLAAIETLQAEGAPVELDLVENTPNDQARLRYAAADLVVDQLNVGWYGLFSIEAMALGKPCIVRLDREAAAESEEAFGHKIPLINADADSLADTIRGLVREPERLTEIGHASRAYVEGVHSHTAVAERMLDVYRRRGIA